MSQTDEYVDWLMVRANPLVELHWDDTVLAGLDPRVELNACALGVLFMMRIDFGCDASLG